jgi:methyl-accepting chemotaxis protein
MEAQQFTFQRFGLRTKVILAMSAALVAIMIIVGLIVYFQVADQLQNSLETRGKELTKSLRSESMVELLYEQKDAHVKKLKKKLEENEEVVYVLVLKQAKKGEEGIGGRPYVLFTNRFREPGKPMDIESLVDIHMSQPGQTILKDDFLGFTEEVRAATMSDEEDETAGLEGGEDLSGGMDELESEALMFGELEEGEGGAEPEAETPSPETPSPETTGLDMPEKEEKPAEEAKPETETPEAETPKKSEKKGALWGYVCLGLSTASLDEQRGWLFQTLFIIMIVAVLGFTTFIFLASNRIYRRLVSMMDAAQRISQGDLTESIAEVSNDEMGMLASALNTITGNLNDIIRKISQVTDSLGEAVERITASTEEVVQGAEYQVASVDETSSSMSEMVISLKGVAENVEILASSAEESSSSIMEMAATNDEVADNISSLASSVEETTTSIEQMTHAIKEVAKSVEDLSTTAEQTSTSMREMDVSIGQVETNANETAAISEEVRRDAERGSDAVKKTIQGIGRISESTRIANTAMVSLGKKVQAIGQVLNVIDDVAEQTNLLALNAAIIAAQAGEHGKGFAVVADEIKDLAERTATSTSEIAELIRAVQTETKSVTEAMEGGIKSVDEGVALSAEAEQALTKILDSSTKSTQMVREIARATVEQARGSKVVTDAIARIAETVQQIASATGQQAKGSEQIMNAAERMKVITQHVHGSSQEQARGSKQITQAIENISEMVHHLNRAQKEQARGSEQVMKAVERIKEVAEHHSDSMSNMKKIVDLVAQQAETLRAEMGRFKL